VSFTNILDLDYITRTVWWEIFSVKLETWRFSNKFTFYFWCKHLWLIFRLEIFWHKICESGLSIAVVYNSWTRDHKPLGKINFTISFLDIRQCLWGSQRSYWQTCGLHHFSPSEFHLLWLHWKNSHFGSYCQILASSVVSSSKKGLSPGEKIWAMFFIYWRRGLVIYISWLQTQCNWRILYYKLHMHYFIFLEIC